MPASEQAPRHSAIRATGRDSGLFVAALRRDKALMDLCRRGGDIFRPFEMLLSDVFAFFHEREVSLTESGGCDKLHYLVMKYLLNAPEYASLHARSAGKYQPALAATEEFGNRLLDHLSVPHLKGGLSRKTGTSTIAVTVDEIVLAEVAEAGNGSSASSGVMVLAKRVEVAIDAIEVLADVCHTFGIGPGQLRAIPSDERASLALKMGNSANLRRFADLVGRWSALAVARSAKRTPGVPEEFSDVSYGDDWHLFVSQELAALAHPALRYDFFLRLIDRKILQYDPQSPGRGNGPIVVCVDTSGSMCGERDISAKAAALALHALARKAGRPFATILFSSRGQTMSFFFRGTSVVSRDSTGQENRITVLEGIMGAATFFFGGGTDYESPLLEAQRVIETGGPDWRDGDIVFLTDDYCDVSEEFKEQFLREKERLSFKIFSVIIGARAEDARTLRKFSDRVVSVSNFDEDVAKQVFDAV